MQELGLNAGVTLYTPDARQTGTADGKILLDGGHNVDAARALERLLNDNVALIGMMKDKNVDGYLSVVAPHCKRIITATVDNPRAMPAPELKRIASKYCDDVISIDAPIAAVNYAKEKGLDLVCGSFYLIREIIKELQ